MFKLKKLLASLLVVSLVLSNSLPSLAESFSNEEKETSVVTEVVNDSDEEPVLDIKEGRKIDLFDDIEEEIEDNGEANSVSLEDEEEKENDSEVEEQNDKDDILSELMFNCRLKFVDANNGYVYYNTSVKDGTEIEVSTYNGFIKSQNSSELKNCYFLTWTDEDGNTYKDGDNVVIERSQEILIDYTYARRLIVGLPNGATLDVDSIDGAYVYEGCILYVDPDKDITLPTVEQINFNSDKLEFGFWTTDKIDSDDENDYNRIETVPAGTEDVEVYSLFRVIQEEEAGPYDLTMPKDWFKYPLYSESGEFIHKAFITKVTFDDSDSAPATYDAHFEVRDEKIATRKIDCYVVNGNELIIYLGDKISTLYTPINASEFFSGFEEVKAYENIELLNTSKTTDFQAFFYDNNKLTNLDLSSFDTSKATNMVMMFNKCSSLKTLDIQNFDTRNVTEMNLMFAAASSLKELDITSFSANKLVDAAAMFANMHEIEKIYASDDFDLSKKGNSIGNIQISQNENLIGTYGFDTQQINDYLDKNNDTVLYSNAFARLDKNSKEITERGIFTDKSISSPEAVEVEEETTKETEQETTSEEITETEKEEETIAPPEVKTYKVYFELNGGNFKNGFDKTIYDAVEVNTQINLPEATALEKEGYTFKGWYKNADLKGTDIKGVKLSEEGSITLYAKWQKNPTYYSVDFNLNSAEFKANFDVNNFKNILTGTETTLPVASDMNYVSTADVEAEFDGWYRNSDYSGERVYKVGLNDEGEVKVYAKWNVTEYVTIEIGPSLRYRYLLEQRAPGTVPGFSSIFIGGTNVTLRVKKGEAIIVPDLNNALHFRTYNVNTRYDEWTGYETTGYRVMRKSNLRLSYNDIIYRPGDEFVVEEDGLIMYGGDSRTLTSKKFTRQEIINTYGEPFYEEVSDDQPFTGPAPKKATAKASFSGGSSGGGGGGSSGGGGGGGGSLPKSSVDNAAAPGPASLTPVENQNNEEINQANKEPAQATNAITNQAEAKQASNNSFAFESSLSTWTQNADGTWSMSIKVDGKDVNASSGFYNLVEKDANTGAQSNAVYYFDEKGQMATGWVKDTNNNYYYFETANNDNVGKMTTGWREINGSTYFFGSDGKMMSNSVTPDGKYVGADGKVVSDGTNLGVVNDVNKAV